jgi:hypothetical protein
MNTNPVKSKSSRKEEWLYFGKIAIISDVEIATIILLIICKIAILSDVKMATIILLIIFIFDFSIIVSFLNKIVVANQFENTQINPIYLIFH